MATGTARPFGILLTGGGSRRLGRDKGSVEVAGETLATRTARLLVAAVDGAVEVGPGTSGLPSVREDPAGAGPLAAVVAGWQALVERTGDKRPAVVLACDLPEVTPGVPAWLAARPGPASAVPVVDGRPQPLCARWSVADLERAVAQLAGGGRTLREVFGPDAEHLDESTWEAVAPASAFADVDTPEDLADRGLAPPPSGDDWIGLSRHPLPTGAATGWATVERCGGVVTFIGTVRDHAEGRAGVQGLAYEAYEGPARARMAAVVAEARRRWPDLGRAVVLHRLGQLGLGETAVTVVASAAHRAEAFAAAAYLIDTVKETVPIWKHERWEGGEGWGTGAAPVRSL